jgi:ATP-dependent Clp protease ATP-binding subunit ClpA
MGARPIIREIQTQIEDKITEYIIDNNIPEYHTFTEQELIK